MNSSVKCAKSATCASVRVPRPLTQDVDASVVRGDPERATSVPHGRSEAPAVRLHLVALHRVQLVGAVVAAHHVDAVAQRAHTLEGVKERGGFLAHTSGMSSEHTAGGFLS